MARAEALKGVRRYQQDGISRVSIPRGLARDPVIASLHRGVAAALPQYTEAALLIRQLLTTDPVDLGIADGKGSKTPRWLQGGFLHTTGVTVPPVIELPAHKGRPARRGMPPVREVSVEELAQLMVRDSRWPGVHNPPAHIAIITEGIDTGDTVRRLAEAALLATADSPVAPRIDVVTTHMEGVVKEHPIPGDELVLDANLRRRTAALEHELPLNGGHVYSPHIRQWESPPEHPALYVARGSDTPLDGPTVGSILSAAMESDGIDAEAVPLLVPLGQQILQMAGQIAGRTYLLEGEESGLIAAKDAVAEALSGEPRGFTLHMPRPAIFDRERRAVIRQLREKELSDTIHTVTAKAIERVISHPGGVDDILTSSDLALTEYFQGDGSWFKHKKEALLTVKKGIVASALQYRLGVHMLAAIFNKPYSAEELLKPTASQQDHSFDFLNLRNPSVAAAERVRFLSTVLRYAIEAHDTAIEGNSQWSRVEQMNVQLDEELGNGDSSVSYYEHGSIIKAPSIWDVIKSMNNLLDLDEHKLDTLGEMAEYQSPSLPALTVGWAMLQDADFRTLAKFPPNSGISSEAQIGINSYHVAPIDLETKETLSEELRIIRRGFDFLGYSLPDTLSPAQLMTYIASVFKPIYAQGFGFNIHSDTSLSHKLGGIDLTVNSHLPIETIYIPAVPQAEQAEGNGVTLDTNTGTVDKIQQVARERAHELAVESRSIAGRAMEELLNDPGSVWEIVNKAGGELAEYMKTQAPLTDFPDGRVLRLKKGIISSALQYLVAIKTVALLLENPQAVVGAQETDFPKNSGDYVAYQLDGHEGFTWFPYYEDARHDFMGGIVHFANRAYNEVVASSPEWSAVEEAKIELNNVLERKGLRSTYSNEPAQNCSPTVWSMMRNMNSILWMFQPVLRALSAEEGSDSVTWSALQSPYFDRPGDLVGLANVTIPTLAEVTPPNEPTEVTVYRDSETEEISRYDWSGRTAELLDNDLGGMCFGFKGLHETSATSPFFESLRNSFKKLGFHLPPRLSAVQIMTYLGALMMPSLAADYPQLRVEANSGIAHQLIRTNAGDN